MAERAEQKKETLQTPGVIEKYQAAGKIANHVVEQIIAKIRPGVSVIDLTTFGDNLIIEQLKGVYAKKKKMEKGIAFPTCISSNDICGHYSPLISDAADKEKPQCTLAEGDVVKVDLGVHIDGFISLLGHTVVCQANGGVVEGKAADVILAAQQSVQAALRLLRPGKVNFDITDMIGKVTSAYKVCPLEGVLSHDLEKHNIDGNHSIISKESFENKIEKHEFEINEVYSINVVVTAGDGKAKESQLRTTVFKRALERQFQLKSKCGKAFYHEIVAKYPTLCFSLRAIEDELTAIVGASDCSKHDLLTPYPVLLDKQGAIVASFNVTALVLQNGTTQISGLPFDASQYKTENTIEDKEIVELLEQSMDMKAQKLRQKQQQTQADQQ